MAVGFNLPNGAFRLSAAEATGQPDYQQALQNVFKNFQGAYDTAYKPKNMAEALRQAQLKNEHDQIINQFLPKKEQAALAHSGLAASLLGMQIESAKRKAAMEKENPFINAPGDLGKIGALIYMQQHPDLFGNEIENQPFSQELPQNPQDIQDINSAQERQSSFIPSMTSGAQKTSFFPQKTQKQNYADMIRQSIMKDVTPHLVGPAAEAASLESLRNQYGENSKIYQDALSLASMKQQERESLNAQRERRASGLKTGEEWVSDQEGNHIGISRDFSPAEKKEEKGRLYFNHTYPFILKSTAYYSGEGSIQKFEHDALRYKKDKAAQKRIDDYLTAIKLVPSSLVKENATVGGANTNQVYNRLVDSLNSSDLPQKVESIVKQFQLPVEAQLRSGQQFNDILNKATEESKKVPARHTEYFSGKRKGHIFDKRTGKLKQVSVSPENWDAFVSAGGY
jgi:hypothetical protein